MAPRSNVIGFDDAPFLHAHRGDVRVVGVVCAGTRLDGLVSGRVRRDGTNSTRVLSELVTRGRFVEHIRAIMMMGLTFAGFNVVDLHALAASTGVPVLVVARRPPDLGRIEAALRTRVRGGDKKWSLIQAAGPMEPLGALWVQRAGLSLAEAQALLTSTTLQGHVPEPLRLAHLIAGGIGNDVRRLPVITQSRGGA